jgi:hypothetical protein
MKTKLNSNEDFQIWYSNQVKKYGSVWSVHSFGVTNVPIDYPCVVLGYEDTANIALFYDFVYLSDFSTK